MNCHIEQISDSPSGYPQYEVEVEFEAGVTQRIGPFHSPQSARAYATEFRLFRDTEQREIEQETTPQPTYSYQYRITLSTQDLIILNDALNCPYHGSEACDLSQRISQQAREQRKSS